MLCRGAIEDVEPLAARTHACALLTRVCILFVVPRRRFEHIAHSIRAHGKDELGARPIVPRVGDDGTRSCVADVEATHLARIVGVNVDTFVYGSNDFTGIVAPDRCRRHV